MFVRFYMRAFRAAEVLAGVSVMRLMKIIFAVLRMQSLNKFTVSGMFAFSFIDGYDLRRSWNSRIVLRKYSRIFL